MNQSPLFSICIPAYKRIEFLERLLHSITKQSFRDFEVIVTDDSPDDSVSKLCSTYGGQLTIRHFKNPIQQGTPENWNEAIRMANGKWIKLMHDDDWFADDGALQYFADGANSNPNVSFLFSAYRNVFLEENREVEVFPDKGRLRAAKKNPATLISNNIIGPPSVTLHKNDGIFFYDNQLKWVVDIEFYIRYLATTEPLFINKVLVNVGMGSEQVTQDSFRVREVEIPEYFHLFNKIGFGNLKNILIFDAWWRLIRNLGIRTQTEIYDSGYSGAIPGVILSMIKWQSHIPRGILRIGVFSKMLMGLNYIYNII